MIKTILAAFSFFTRLPAWRLTDIPAACYSRVVEFWPLTGWLTGGVTALVIWGLAHCLPILPAVISGYVARLLLTGALHEDGLADFIDGMGGGRTRQRTLEIMKDSHIGSYGVIGLICYYLLLTTTVASLPLWIIPLVVVAADPWGKFCGELIVTTLPYARKAEEAKNKTVYTRIKPGILLTGALIALLPTLLLLILPSWSLYSILLLPVPLAVSGLLILLMRRRIGGYTGDCCGAVFLLSELAFILTASILTFLNPQSIS